MTNAEVAVPMTHLKWENLPASMLISEAEHRHEWDALNAQRHDWPFLGGQAVALALEIFGSGKERLLIGRDGGAVKAMLVLVPQGFLRWQSFQPSQIPLGCWVAAPEIELATLTRQVLRLPLRNCLALTMTQVDPMMAARSDDAADTECSDYIETGWLGLDGDFDSYWASRGKNLRQNVRKQHNRLEAAGRTVSMLVLTDAADMAEAVAQYARLESSGWKTGQGTAVRIDNSQGHFYKALMEQAAGSGEALVYQCLFDGRVVSTDLCLLRNATLTILKTTYDETEQAHSPSTLLREWQMRHLYGGTATRLEYFGRYMEWHSRWTESKRTLYHFTVFRWAWLKRLVQARRKEKPMRSGEVPEGQA